MFSWIIRSLKYFFHLFKYNIYMDTRFALRHFRNSFGEPINLDNPKTFTDKIIWLTLFDRRKIKTELADKFAVRNYVKEILGEEYLIPLKALLPSADQLNLESIPSVEPCVIKTTHDSHTIFLIRNKSDIDIDAMKGKLSDALHYNYYHACREWQYKDIKPQIIIEEMLRTPSGAIPTDFKFHCFNGEPEYIQVVTGRYAEQMRRFYDKNWRALDTRQRFPLADKEAPPENLHIMLDCARALSAPFDFVRVDLYNLSGKIYFGEMTFTPDGGHLYFKPACEDLTWGAKLRISALD